MKATEITGHNHTYAQNHFAVIPIVERLEADTTCAGQGITIAILDSGFYPHPDLTTPRNRIAAYHDVTKSTPELDALQSPEAWDWYGTQTSATAAGHGHLSDCVYRSLASADCG